MLRKPTDTTLLPYRLLLQYVIVLAGLLPALASSSGPDIHNLEQQLADAESAGSHRDAVAALVALSDAMIENGAWNDSLKYLQRARVHAETSDDVATRANVLSRLADTGLVMGHADAAAKQLEEALSLAREADQPALEGTVLINLGNLHAHNNETEAALRHYREALQVADNAGDRRVAAHALTNITRLQVARNAADEAGTALTGAADRLAALPDDHDKAFLLLALARLGQDIKAATITERHALVKLRYRLLLQAARISGSSGSPRLASLATGYLGELYHEDGRSGDAERLLRKAIFLAREAAANDILYLWQWRLGRIQAQQGQVEVALQSYRDAVLTLQQVRPQFDRGLHRQRGSFRETTGPLYYELADLLLKAPPGSKAAADTQARLREARQTVELLKAVELQDYFQDTCVTALSSRTSGIDRVAPQTAVLYMIELPDRLELLLSLPQGLEQVTVPIDSGRLHAEIKAFRQLLEKRTTRQYLKPARQLYDWMIRPIEPILAEHSIDTLVTVPQGSMNTIPIAALNDGKQFLIEKFALATTPGLSLTDPGALDKQGTRVLLAGLSDGVQGFPPLPAVPSEIKSVAATFSGEQLQDQAFSYDNMTRALQREPYPVVHIASHAQFKGRSADTFLLTWHEQINLDRLESLVGLGEFRSQPVELLVLSACQTAAGDEQAAMGLAGVAVKAGARSALASLWFVNDQSTSRLVTEFYAQLKQPDTSKAGALQAAQVATLRDLRYRHPGYWAPFLLIGNWL